MEFRRVLCRSYTGSYPACNEAPECLAGLQHRLIPPSQIDTRRVEEIIPHRVRWNDHTALSLAQHGHLFDPFRKRDILGKTHSLRPIGLKNRGAGHDDLLCISRTYIQYGISQRDIQRQFPYLKLVMAKGPNAPTKKVFHIEASHLFSQKWYN